MGNPIRFIDSEGTFVIHPDIKAKYPKVYEYLTKNLKDDVMKSQDIKRVYMLLTNATEEQIMADFTNDSGPGLISDMFPGMHEFGIPGDAVGFYSKEFNRIEINDKVFKYVEDVLKNKKNKEDVKLPALMVLFLAIIHEEAHRLENKYGKNENTDIKKFPTVEVGYDAERYIFDLPRNHNFPDRQSKIPGVFSKNDKLIQGVTEWIIENAKLKKKTSNLPTPPPPRA